jgi:hypothetical protein
MGKLVGSAFLAFVVGTLLLVTLFHLIFSLPVWLVIGGIALYLWMRNGSRGRRLFGRRHAGYLERRARW